MAQHAAHRVGLIPRDRRLVVVARGRRARLVRRVLVGQRRSLTVDHTGIAEARLMAAGVRPHKVHHAVTVGEVETRLVVSVTLVAAVSLDTHVRVVTVRVRQQGIVTDVAVSGHRKGRRYVPVRARDRRGVHLIVAHQSRTAVTTETVCAAQTVRRRRLGRRRVTQERTGRLKVHTVHRSGVRRVTHTARRRMANRTDIDLLGLTVYRHRPVTVTQIRTDRRNVIVVGAYLVVDRRHAARVVRHVVRPDTARLSTAVIPVTRRARGTRANETDLRREDRTRVQRGKLAGIVVTRAVAGALRCIVVQVSVAVVLEVAVLVIIRPYVRSVGKHVALGTVAVRPVVDLRLGMVHAHASVPRIQLTVAHVTARVAHRGGIAVGRLVPLPLPVVVIRMARRVTRVVRVAAQDAQAHRYRHRREVERRRGRTVLAAVNVLSRRRALVTVRTTVSPGRTAERSVVTLNVRQTRAGNVQTGSGISDGAHSRAIVRVAHDARRGAGPVPGEIGRRQLVVVAVHGVAGAIRPVAGGIGPVRVGYRAVPYRVEAAHIGGGPAGIVVGASRSGRIVVAVSAHLHLVSRSGAVGARHLQSGDVKRVPARSIRIYGRGRRRRVVRPVGVAADVPVAAGAAGGFEGRIVLVAVRTVARVAAGGRMAR